MFPDRWGDSYTKLKSGPWAETKYYTQMEIEEKSWGVCYRNWNRIFKIFKITQSYLKFNQLRIIS